MEITIAFHYVFDSPHDKVIWDVSHQSYAHKMLTGRKLGFLDPDHYEDITGFTSPEESAHDFLKLAILQHQSHLQWGWLKRVI